LRSMKIFTVTYLFLNTFYFQRPGSRMGGQRPLSRMGASKTSMGKKQYGSRLHYMGNFCRPLYVFLFFFFWLLYCLFFMEVQFWLPPSYLKFVLNRYWMILRENEDMITNCETRNCKSISYFMKKTLRSMKIFTVTYLFLNTFYFQRPGSRMGGQRPLSRMGASKTSMICS
jgi:hypothetical protein